jgi:hypothetical protein
MNISKTNKLGLLLIDDDFKAFKGMRFKEPKKNVESKINGVKSDELEEDLTKQKITYLRTTVLNDNRDLKVMRLSKNILENCKLINLEHVKENLFVEDFDFESLVILLGSDNEGLIKISRVGSDFDFIFLENLNDLKVHYNTYNFLSNDFYLQYENMGGNDLVIKILTYLYYGDITSKFIPRKAKVKINNFKHLLNNSKHNIVYVDSLWKQRISTEGFKVSGHFRLQPFGEGRKKRRLIWIESFNKEGYNRLATVEL